MKNILKLLSAVIMVTAISCTKDNKSGINTVISLTFKGTTALPGIKKSLNTEGFTFTEALLGIKEIEIKKVGDVSNNDGKFDFDKNYIVDLLAGTTTPAFGTSEFLPGRYNKLESKTSNLLDGGNSVSLKGTYTDNVGTTYKFEFSSTSVFKFEVESDTGFILSEGTIFSMLVNVTLPVFFQGVDFSKAAVNSSGIIVINDISNIPMSEIIKSNINLVADMEDENESEHDTGHH
jgi:hypothetical protein